MKAIGQTEPDRADRCMLQGQHRMFGSCHTISPEAQSDPVGEVLTDDQLGDLHGVEGGSLAQVVIGHEH